MNNELVCRAVNIPDACSWETLEAVFAGAAVCPLGQFWRPSPESGFRPAAVRVGWRPGELLVYAELMDDDAFNPVTEFNGMLFQHGDVFEIFLRPDDQEAYFEFHVAPGNQKFQLRIPSQAEFRKPREQPGVPPAWFVRHPVITSRISVEPERKRWRVLAGIPFSLVAERSAPKPGSRWRFSFSRYDYTRGVAEPVLSSSSPHRQLSFHIQDDWGTLVFQ